MGLLCTSLLVVLLMLGGGVALKAGAAENDFHNPVVFTEILQLVQDNYVDDVDSKRLMRGAFEGLLDGLDGQGSYLTPDEVAWWKKPAGDLSADPGIVVLKSGGTLQVVALADESPAKAAGLSLGDQIRKIDDRFVRDMSIEEARRLLAGAPGTSVQLAVLHVRESFKREDLTIRRALRTARAYTMTVRDGIAVLTVHDCARVDGNALATELDGVRSRGIDRLLVDLRSAADGSPREAAGIADLFASGALFHLKDRAGHTLETLSARRSSRAWSGKVGVLVNGATAGAAEGLAKVLQTVRGATVFGENSYGLGAEPSLIELPDGSGLLIPTRVWETHAGKRWNGDGVVPDQLLRAEGGADDPEADQLKRAIELFTHPPAPEAKPKAA